MSSSEYISGWFSGIAGLAVGHPLDTVKVKQQIKGLRASEVALGLFKQEGIKGFFRGLGFPLLANGALNSVFFGVYGSSLEFCKSINWSNSSLRLNLNPSRNVEKRSTHFESYICGCFAGLVQVGIACPVDVVKVKLQNDTMRKTRQYTGSVDCAKQIYKSRGMMGFFQGIGTMTFRDVPAWGLYTLMYRILCEESNIDKKGTEPNSLKHFLSGGMAGVISWMSIVPLDTIKSRVQADDSLRPKYNGLIDCGQKIIKEQGIGGFFRGTSSIVVRAFLVNGVTFLTYEWFLFLCHYVSNDLNA